MPNDDNDNVNNNITLDKMIEEIRNEQRRALADRIAYELALAYQKKEEEEEKKRKK